MSEGWLTESALLPKAPIPIQGVGDRTLRPLKTALAETKEGTSTKEVSVDTVKGSRLPQGNRSKRKRDTDEETDRRAIEVLSKKSLLYQDLASGARSEESVVTELDQRAKQSAPGTRVTSDDLLIDFQLKQKLNESSTKIEGARPINSKLSALRARKKEEDGRSVCEAKQSESPRPLTTAEQSSL
eukprot:Blabericola_migrator_1__2645@NODE_174_length_12052_cov_318_013433_g151_i0_p5_GENE_NODE_174_length_12052_cov_318_013433_g151_i0NODE_174_length_12052_cov_318_013433_g151_i0_p5_ORF_typecomplete_len185_score44_59_NODE_174_length_12052_cov_318_013433_g151_i083248878